MDLNETVDAHRDSVAHGDPRRLQPAVAAGQAMHDGCAAGIPRAGLPASTAHSGVLVAKLRGRDGRPSFTVSERMLQTGSDGITSVWSWCDGTGAPVAGAGLRTVSEAGMHAERVTCRIRADG